jgi:NADH dehydrogenase [ubiquinone] 1 alpha subcomplex assembly factor 7
VSPAEREAAPGSADRRVHDAVEAAIRDHGPITFAEYVEHALYGPGGFYERPPVGADREFVTSPHVHPVFGELLGRALRALWEASDRPVPWRVAEVGAGDGTLARQLLEALADIETSYTAVEVSTGAQAALAAIDGLLVTHELRGEHDLVLAHELLDNLPFRVVRDGREVRVGLDDRGRLTEVDTDLDDELRAIGADGVVPVGALAFVDRLAEAIPRGYALLIDYGDVDAAGGEVHGYRGQRLVENVLAHPGTADITAGVHLGLIAERARVAGFEVYGPVRQHHALRALGFEDWLREELARQRDQLDAREGLDAVRTWSGRSRATLLADPSGLGRLWWLLLATPGLPAPPWIGTPETDAPFLPEP